MPRGDRTGPAGQGPMTGRNLGFCAGYPSAGFTRGYGAGMGRGFGGGMGRGRGFGYNRDIQEQPATLPESNIESLKNEAKSLSERLDAVLNSIEKMTKKE